jgi:putative PIN family toxin of toxin-antitoxin system
VRIVIDTNVYISSLLFKGKAREVYDICIANTDIFISDFIVSELTDKLSGKFAVPSRTVKEIIKSILSIVEVTVPNTALPKVCRDKDLLVLIQYASTQILNPTDFLKLFV